MALLERPLVVVGDVHLSHDGHAETGRDLARLVALHPGAEIVLNGDIFNLSLDPPTRDPVDSVLGMLGREPELKQALGNHLRAGGPLRLLPGNHDAALASDGLGPALAGLCEVAESAPLEIAPWFLRRGPIHVEHGHAYDPDNAPTHPLCAPSPATEPLGVALTRRFVAPNQAFDFAHATEITPVEALARAWRTFGPRMPLVLASYFHEASKFCREAGFRPALAEEMRTGDARVRAAAEREGVDPACLRAVLDDRPRPTHESFERAFFRLYFDRVVATLGTGAFLGLGLLSRSRTALGLGALAALYLANSVRGGPNRYGGLAVRRLRAASARVRALTGAEVVIFGHTHVPETTPGYVNPGSFTYRAGPGRPYVLTSGDVPEVRLLPVA